VCAGRCRYIIDPFIFAGVTFGLKFPQKVRLFSIVGKIFVIKFQNLLELWSFNIVHLIGM